MNIKTNAMKKIISCGALSFIAMSAYGEETVLKFADWLPLSHYGVKEGATPWIEAISEFSNGEIKIEYYPNQQIGKAADMGSLVNSGVADISNVSPAYTSSKFPLSGVAELPGLFDSSCHGTKALMRLLEPGNYLYEREFSPQGLRPIWALAYAPYKVITVDQPVSRMADLEGLKLRSAGGAMDITISEIGGVPVSLAGPDILQSMERGTLDGGLFPLLSIPPYELQNVINYITEDGAFASFISVYVISERTWNSLSPEHKEIISETGKETANSICTWIDDNETKIIDEMQAEGIEIVEMDSSEMETLENRLEKVREVWAQELNEMGRDGSGVLKAYTEALREVGSN